MKTLHLLTNKSRFDSLSLVCRQSDFAKFAISLVLFLCLGIGQMWGANYTLAASTFNSDRNVATVSGQTFTLSQAHAGQGQTGYTDYIKLSKNNTYTITLPTGFALTNINIKGYTNKNNDATGAIKSIGGNNQTGKTFPAKNASGLASTPQITTGYNFAISQTGGTVAITTANTQQICVLITITGTPAAAPSTYTVTYNGSGKTSGSVPTDGTSYSSGATVTVLGNTGSMTRSIDGAPATFLGWNTNSDMHSGTHYDAGDEFTITANTTLYAVWGFNITYIDEDKSTELTGLEPTYYIYGEGATLPPTPTKSGYTFAGWYNAWCVDEDDPGDSPCGGSAPCGFDDTYCKTTAIGTSDTWDAEYYAKWTANTYSVTHTLTNVTASSGATGASAASSGSAYNATFAASSGYTLPSTISVTIGGNAATAGTDYTWNSSTGAFEVPAEKVTGNIVITIVGEAIPSAWIFKCENDSWVEHMMDESAGVASYSIDLPADSRIEFCFDDNGTIYKNNGAIITTTSGWTFNTSDNNCRIHTGPAGTYTFAINTTSKAVTVTYPTVSHPNEHYVYFKNSDVWGTVKGYLGNTGNSNKAAAWPGSDMQVTTTICGETYHYAALNAMSGTYNVIIFNNGSGGYGNQTSDLSADGLGKYNANRDANWHDFTTYTISFNNGGGSGTMSPITDICPNEDQAITANSFTKSSYTFDHWTANVDVRVGGATVTAGDPIANGATIQNITSNITLTAQWVYGGPTIVNIPGTVDKGNVGSYIASMTWYGVNDEYFDFGPTAAANTDRWVEWDVNLLYSEEYSVTEVFEAVDGHEWQLELLDGSRNVVSTYNTTRVWSHEGERTDANKWDLSGVATGNYTLRVTNAFGWAQPKLKSITLSFPFSYTKVPDRALYGDEGDAHRAYGTINNNVVNVPLSSTGAISKNDETRTLTIGSQTVIAPETETGRLDNIPYDKDPYYTNASPTWRFDHWDITNLNDIKAVYIPTFAVDYQTNGGVIHNDPYAHWYRYTGREEDYTELPMDLTKEGFVFAGWYQNSTTQLFSTLPGHYYGGYVKSPSCETESCDYRLKAHWILDCDEAQVLSGVKITGSGTSSYDVYGYNEEEYAGTPVVNVGSTTVTADADNDGNNETGYELDTDGSSIVFATLKKGEFRAGDLIRVVITRKNTNRIISSSPDNITLYYGTGTSDAHVLVNIQRIKSDTVVEYYLDADDVDEMELASANGVGVFRESSNGENPCVYSVEIIGCRDLVFDDAHGTHVWSDPLNWGPTHSEIPHYYQATRINKPCIVDIANAKALNVKLCKQYEDRNGSLVINANAGLEVTQRVSEVHGTDYSTLYPVQASDLVILSNASNQGALVHGDNGSNTHATVQFYARGNGAERVGNTSNLASATWQYMGVPFSDVTNALYHYYDGWMCQWIENTVGNAGSNWKWIVSGNPLYPFTGYCLTQNAAKTYTNTGTLVPSTNRDLTVTYTTGEGYGYFGWNMFANSYMAPINIAAFEAGDFVGDIEKTIYLFNTGISDGTTAAQGEGAGAGQYVTIPVSSAGSMLPANQYIAPMQGFYILATAAGTHTVTLNYDRLVRKSDHSALSVGPNRAKKEDDEPMMARIIIDVKGVHFSDRLYVFENAEQTNGFDNGWDGWKFEGESYAPQLMTRTGDLDLAVDVSPAFGGKRIAFRVGEDSEYTLHFSTTEEGLYLRDLSNDMETEITEGGTYTFMAFNTTTEERFEIIDRRAEMPNDIENVTDNVTYDILDMTVYTAEGRLVLHRTTDFNKPLNLSTGMYVIYLNTTAGTQVHKIVF